MTKISDQTSLAGSAVDPAADLFPIVDMSEAGTARNKKITPDEVKIALDLDTSASPQFTALNLGHASDTTITRVSAGVVAIEGANVVTTAGGVTFAADISVPDDAYDATTWNGNVEVPTKNAVRDKIESLSIGGGIDVEDEGVSEATGVTTLNFTGAGVVASDAGGGVVDVTIAGGGSGIDVEDEGVSEATGATTLNFVGAGVTAADVGGGVVDVTISGSAFSGALVHKAADQTTADYSAFPAVSWDSETNGYDTDSYHDNSTNPSRLSVPAAGKYRVGGQVCVTGGTLTASDYVRLSITRFNSSNVAQSTIGLPSSVIVEISATPTVAIMAWSAPIECSSGDYFVLTFDTESDTSITVQANASWFAIERVS